MKNYNDLNDYEIMYLISENNENAYDLMLKKYYPLIETIAMQYYKSYKDKNWGLELDDFIQEGYIGLYNAIKNYTDDKDCLFYTYALISIRSKMNNIVKTYSTDKKRILSSTISLNNCIGDDSDSELLDIIEDCNALLPDYEFEKNDFYLNIKSFLYSLTFNESMIFELKMNGFNNKEISKLLDLNLLKIRSISRMIRKKYIH